MSSRPRSRTRLWTSGVRSTFAFSVHSVFATIRFYRPSRGSDLGVFGARFGDAMGRHDFHWLDDGEHEVPTVRTLGVQLSKLSVEGEGEGGELGEGEIVFL